MNTLKSTSHKEMLLSLAEVPNDLPKHVSHILEFGTGPVSWWFRLLSCGPTFRPRRAVGLHLEGSLVLFGTSFEVKDSGLNILTCLSKPALSIRSGPRPAHPETCPMLHYQSSTKQRHCRQMSLETPGLNKVTQVGLLQGHTGVCRLLCC